MGAGLTLLSDAIFVSAKWTEWMADIMCSFDMCLSVCLSACAQQTGQSDQFKTVKATDFKFDMHVSRDSLDMTPLKIFRKGASVKIHLALGRDMHSHERLLVSVFCLSFCVLEPQMT